MNRALQTKRCATGAHGGNRRQQVAYLKRSAFLIALAFSGTGMAQTPPTIGHVLESVPELRAVPARPDAGSLQFAAPEPAPAAIVESVPDAPRVHVRALVISGNTVFSEAALLALLQDGIGRELTLAGIEQLIARIGSYYHAQGYLLARAYVPAQSIKDGRVEIAVTEGVLGEVHVQRDKSVRLQQERIEAVLAQLKPGAPVHVPTIERALLLLTDLPGVSASSTLRPGRKPGSADLVVALKEGRPLQATLGFDNYGNKYTGRTRTTLGVAYNDLTGVGDQLSFQGVRGGAGLTSARIGYESPLGANGLRLRLSYADLQYELGDVFEVLGVQGDSQIFSASLQYPLLRTRAMNLSLFGGLDQKYLGSEVKTLGVNSNKVVTSANVGLSASLQDDFLGGGVTAASVTLTGGKLDLRSPADVTLDQIGPSSEGGFSKFNWQAGRVQRLAPRWSLVASLAGQSASRNLDSSEKFFIGGPTSVRAYPVGEAAGDQGVMGTLELRYELPQPGMQLVGFVDGGKVRYNADPYFYGTNSRRLAGAGLGLNWDINGIGSLRTSYAQKTGSRDGDSDASKDRQFWVALTMPPEALFALPAITPNSSDASRVQIYGVMDLSQEFVERRGATEAGPRGATQSATPTGENVKILRRMRSNSSALGFKGRERLARGLSVWYQLESTLGVVDESAALGNRNSGLGITSSRWGTLMAGLWDAPYKASTSSLDPFSGKYFNSFYTILGNPSFSVATATAYTYEGTPNAIDRTDASFTRRQGNAVQYWTPKVGGLSARFLYAGDDTSMAPQAGEAEIFSSALTYETGPLEFSAAYERHDNYFGVASLGRNNRGMGSTTGPTTPTTSKDDAMKLAVSYRSGPTRVGLILERLRYREFGVQPALTVPDLQAYQRDAAWLGISHRIGNYRLKGAYGIAEKGKCAVIVVDPTQQACSTEGLGAEMLALGVEYNFSRRTGIYANYGQVRNRPSANYNFVSGGVFGAGVGSDLRGIGFGMTHRF